MPREFTIRSTRTNGGEGTNGAENGQEPRRVLVTGGDGYIGCHLSRMLLESGVRVRVLSNFIYHTGHKSAPTVPGLRDDSRVELVVGDVRNLRDVRKAVQGCTAVVALAAIVGDGACDLDPDETISTNYEALPILLDACRHAGVERLVYASTCAVYGAAPQVILNEGSRRRTLSLYAETRLAAEEVVMGADGRELTTVALRLATVFGLSPRMRFDLMVNTMTADAWRTGVIRVRGRDQWRPHVHVQDAARAFVVALEADRDLVHGEVFNVGADHLNRTIGAVAELVRDTVPGARIEYDPHEPRRRDYRVSFEKIRHLLGFEPWFDLRDGIREVHHALEHRLAGDPRDPAYSRVELLRRVWNLRRQEDMPAQTARGDTHGR
jgi:nucleoside-diphosphate-sugar epimerase